ncbi:uncharacterized protein [Nicotiana sylvestris]|uniref:uncharacterized protein n=1 Tax=Nicotiana sylvestris TaxID=4096 RepID=UPI00388CDAB9
MANFWKKFQQGLGTQVNLSTTFHLQTDGKAERTIQTLEDMLHACVLDFKDVRRRDLEFKEDDWVFLKVSPVKGVMRFCKEREIESEVVGNPSGIVPVETIEGNEELSYEEIPVVILDRQVRKLRNKRIASVKVLWKNQQIEEATWETEEEMKRKYPRLFE